MSYVFISTTLEIKCLLRFIYCDLVWSGKIKLNFQIFLLLICGKIKKKPATT